MDELTLGTTGFGLALALLALWLLTALARKRPFWVPGLVLLAAAVLLAVTNTRPPVHHAEPALMDPGYFFFQLQNGVAVGLAVAGGLGLAAGIRRRLRGHD